MDTVNIEPSYLSKEGAKIYTGLSPSYLEAAVKRGELRCYKVGKRVLFSRQDLDRFIRGDAIDLNLDRFVRGEPCIDKD